jgi:hypothetical protein
MDHAIDMNSALLLGSDIDAGNRGIDDGGGAAGLTNYYISHDELLLSEDLFDPFRYVSLIPGKSIADGKGTVKPNEGARTGARGCLSFRAEPV